MERLLDGDRPQRRSSDSQQDKILKSALNFLRERFNFVGRLIRKIEECEMSLLSIFPEGAVDLLKQREGARAFFFPHAVHRSDSFGHHVLEIEYQGRSALHVSSSEIQP